MTMTAATTKRQGEKKDNLIKTLWKNDISWNYKFAKLVFLLGILAAVAMFSLVANFHVASLIDATFWPAFALWIAAIGLYVRATRMDWKARAHYYRNRDQ
jgi:hypothetical protein